LLADPPPNETIDVFYIKKRKAYGGYAERYSVTRHNNSVMTQIPLI